MRRFSGGDFRRSEHSDGPSGRKARSEDARAIFLTEKAAAPRRHKGSCGHPRWPCSLRSRRHHRICTRFHFRSLVTIAKPLVHLPRSRRRLGPADPPLPFPRLAGPPNAKRAAEAIARSHNLWRVVSVVRREAKSTEAMFQLKAARKKRWRDKVHRSGEDWRTWLPWLTHGKRWHALPASPR